MSLLALLPVLALAQDGFDGHGFQPAPGDLDVADPLAVWRPEAQVPGSWSANGLFEYANRPLVLATATEDGGFTTEPLLDHLVGLNVGGQLAVHERIAVAVTMPVWFTSTGASGGQGVALGDARLYVPVTLLAPGSGPGISLIPFGDLPSGARGKLLGDGGLGGGLLAAAGFGTASLDAAVNAGAEIGPSLTYRNLEGGARLLTGASFAWMPKDTLGLRLEANLRPILAKNAYPWTDSPGEVIASVRGRSDGGLRWTAGAATAITPGAGAAAFRVFAGAGWTGGKDIVRDSDGDGFLDDVDACVAEPETVNAWKDTDGCPDALGGLRVVVRDGDGAVLRGATVAVGDASLVTGDDGSIALAELMPGTALAATVEAERHVSGGGEATVEEGREALIEVGLAWRPGTLKVVVRDQGGRPIPAGVIKLTDADLRVSELVIGPDGTATIELPHGDYGVAAVAENYGIKGQTATIRPAEASVLEFSLKVAKVKVTLDEIVILEKVFFDSAKATIKPESFELLNEVAEVISANPRIRLIEVQGHTDDQGKDAYNLDLSQQRVESVRTYLMERGVAGERLVAKGYGETAPIASNKTPDGRAANRRVQFKILEQDRVTIEVDADKVGK